MKNEEKIISLLELILDKQEVMEKQLENRGKQLESQGKQLGTQGEDIASLKTSFINLDKKVTNVAAIVEQQGKDILQLKDTSDILKTGLINLQRGQNQHQTMIEALYAGMQDIKENMATKSDIEEVESIMTLLLNRVEKHNKRLNKIEAVLNFSHKN